MAYEFIGVHRCDDVILLIHIICTDRLVLMLLGLTPDYDTTYTCVSHCF